MHGLRRRPFEDACRENIEASAGDKDLPESVEDSGHRSDVGDCALCGSANEIHLLCAGHSLPRVRSCGHGVADGVSISAGIDLVYGGGLTSHGEFRPSIVIAIACAFAYCGWRVCTNRVAVVILGILFSIWVLFVSREWRRELAFASAGHLGELILATVFLYKALFDEGWHWPQAERPAAAFVAAFVQINSIAFCLKLLGNPEFLAWYREGKGGAMMNDLEVIALDIHIWLGPEPGIEGIARWLCALSFLPSLAALLLYLQRPKWASLSDVDRYG